MTVIDLNEYRARRKPQVTRGMNGWLTVHNTSEIWDTLRAVDAHLAKELLAEKVRTDHGLEARPEPSRIITSDESKQFDADTKTVHFTWSAPLEDCLIDPSASMGFGSPGVVSREEYDWQSNYTKALNSYVDRIRKMNLGDDDEAS